MAHSYYNHWSVSRSKNPQTTSEPAVMAMNKRRHGWLKKCGNRPLSQKQRDLLRAVSVVSFISVHMQTYRSQGGELMIHERKISKTSTRVDVYTDADSPRTLASACNRTIKQSTYHVLLTARSG